MPSGVTTPRRHRENSLMRRGPFPLAGVLAFGVGVGGARFEHVEANARAPSSYLDTHMLVTWYGNPHSRQMGVLGEQSGADRAEALKRQAFAYAALTEKQIVPAYHLVAVIAQPTVGGDGKCRRRESPEVITALLEEARAYGFELVLDIQPGRSSPAAEIDYLQPFLAEPDVHLALDPEYGMSPHQLPGCQIGSLDADAINAAIDRIERVVMRDALPTKVLILHQFTLAMLPDKERIRRSPVIDLVLDMDGFGSQALKLASYRAIMRQRALSFAGMKLFYRLDTELFAPAAVMALQPTPSVVIDQ